MSPKAKLPQAEIDDLISHVMSLRRDFIDQLLGLADVPYSGLRKPELRAQLRFALDRKRITPEQIIEFLDRVEPGGKQHVYLFKVRRSVNDPWRDTATQLRSLRRRPKVRALLDAHVPVAMPESLTLTSVRVDADLVEVVGVRARSYTEHVELLDFEDITDEGLPVEFRAYVQRVARSTATLRWHLGDRTAELRITQATERGTERDYYSKFVNDFAGEVAPWIDFSGFQKVRLEKVIHKLQERERTKSDPLTRSRRGAWELLGGSGLSATSASSAVSVFSEVEMVNAIGAVASPSTGQAGNLYWLASAKGVKGAFSEDLHTTLIASDGRVHFMKPSSAAAVEYVLGQVRSLS